MSDESNRTATKTTTLRSSDLKASDFFPPGEGWNRAPMPRPLDNGGKLQPDTTEDRSRH